MNFRIPEIVDFIRARGAKVVALQLPEGLKIKGLKLVAEIEEQSNCQCIILGDPCYGACDLSKDFHSIADVLVHFAHTPIPSLGKDEDVLFIEAEMDCSVDELLPKLLPMARKHIGLVSTSQHLPLLPKIKEWLESKGVEAHIGQGDRRVSHAGQILGCNVTSAKSIQHRVDQFLFIGTGGFHALAVALETKKDVLILDPALQEIRDVRELKDRVLRQRYAAIALASEAKDFAVIISTKIGQKRKELAFSLRSLLKSRGKNAVLIAMDNVTPEQLLSFRVDIFVSTACPRIAIDEAARFHRPIITPLELEIALGIRSWDDYAFDSISG
ncbi:MAG: diphthamide biosynthesis enzyme Dph2 [Methanomassiliicoccales archaeon]